MSQLNVKITFTEEVLGTTSGDPELFDNFIASKAPNAKTREEEIANYGAENVAASKMTVFNKQNGVPFLYDYQIKGFFKDACSMLSRVAAVFSAHSERAQSFRVSISRTRATL